MFKTPDVMIMDKEEMNQRYQDRLYKGRKERPHTRIDKHMVRSKNGAFQIEHR